jgi:hypothetical protein
MFSLCSHHNLRKEKIIMAKKTISNNQLTPDAVYFVRGKVGYSRITRHTTDEERETANKRRTHPIDKNYTSVTLYDAQVLAKDPQNPTIEERYAVECLYHSSSPNYPGNNFQAMNKSRNLPQVGVIQAGTNHYDGINIKSELASGLDVTLVMRVFKGQGNNGVSLDKVLVNEPIRYYGGNSNVDKALEDLGITFSPAVPEPEVQNEAPAAAAQQAEYTAPAAQTQVQDANPFASMSQMTAPVQNIQPVQDTVPDAGAAAPAAQAAPVASGNPFSSYGAAPGNMTFGPGENRTY